MRQVIYRYPWPRPVLLCLLLGTVFFAVNRRFKFFYVTIDPFCLEIDIQYAVNVKADVDGSDPIETEGLEDLRLE